MEDSAVGDQRRQLQQEGTAPPVPAVGLPPPGADLPGQAPPHPQSGEEGAITRTRTPGTTLLIRQDTVPSKMSASLALVDADAIDPQSGHSMQLVGPHGTVGQTRSACGESRKAGTGGSLLPSNCHAATRSRRPKYSTIRVVLSRQAIVLCQDGQQIVLSHPSSHVSHFFMIPAAVPVSFRYWQACYLFPLRCGANPGSRSTMPDGRSVFWPSSPSTCVIPPERRVALTEMVSNGDNHGSASVSFSDSWRAV